MGRRSCMAFWHRVFSFSQIAQSMVCDQAFSGLTLITPVRKPNVDRQPLSPAHLVTGNIRRNYQGKFKSNLHFDFVKYCLISSFIGCGNYFVSDEPKHRHSIMHKFRAAFWG